MDITDFKKLKEHTDRTICLDTINIKSLWDSLYHKNFIHKEHLHGKLYVLRITKNNDYQDIPINVEEFVFTNKKELLFRASSDMDEISTEGLSLLFHKKELTDIKMINDEIHRMNNIKECLWERLMTSGALPIS